MQELFEKAKKIIETGGFADVSMSVDEEHRKISFLVDDRTLSENVTTFLPALDHILGLMFRKEKQAPFVIDINYYRKERERLIAELARAAAKKAMLTKQDVELPPMNGYERRLVHMEIAAHPELRTESSGEGKSRKVVIKRIEE